METMQPTEASGLVVRATGSWYEVASGGRTLRCRIRGRLRLKGIRSTNPVVVGDVVRFEEGEEGEGSIFAVEPRRNYIIRRASNLSKESHIIAANVDQALLLVTLSEPVTAPEFVDRFLVTCEAYKVPVTLVLAKRDLQSDEAVAAFRAVYEAAGYPVLEVAALEGRGVEEVRALLAGRTTLFSGNSGVGKSTLVQAIDHDHLLDDVSARRRGLAHRHAGHQGLRPHRHRRRRAVALLPRDDAPGARLPILQLHPHPRTGMRRRGGRRAGRGGVVAIRKLPENPRRR